MIRKAHAHALDLSRLPAMLWLFLAGQVLATVFVLSNSEIDAFDWSLLALLSVYIQWIILFTLFGWRRIHRLEPALRDALAFFANLGWLLVSVAVCNCLAQWVLNGLHWQWSAKWLLRDAMIATPLAIMLQRHLYFMQCWRDEQRALQRAKFAALQARIRPHFLFNTLNTIASLIGHAPDEAEHAIEDLAVLLRKSLVAGEQLLPWQQELALCRAYLDIEKLRLGRRLQIVWQLAAVPDDLLMPSLILQPLCENAVQHGVEPLPAGGVITVQATALPERVIFSISNPLDARLAGNAVRWHNGMALDNIAARLAAIYRDPETGRQPAKLIFERRESCAVAHLVIPCWRAESEH